MALIYTHEKRTASQAEDLVTALAIAYSLIPEGHPEGVLMNLRATHIRSIE